MIDHDEFMSQLGTTISTQNKLLECRPPSPNHSHYIKSAIKFTKDDKEFIDLLKYTFWHHDLIDFQYIAFQDVNIKAREDVSRYFHHHGEFYIRPEIIQGQSEGNPSISYDEFFTVLSDDLRIGDQNNLSFLVGGVGIGKTTFLCNFICRNIQKFLRKRIVPVKINLDISSSHTIPGSVEIIQSIRRSVLTSLTKNRLIDENSLERLAMDCRLPVDADLELSDANLLHMTRLLSDRFGIRILLFIDNIDFLYHLGDRGFFAPGGDNHPERAQVLRAHRTIVEIIDLLWRNGENHASHLGMSIVIACRQDTISFLMSKQHEVPIIALDDRIFSLRPPQREQASAVIHNRFAMLITLCEKVPEQAKRKEFATQINSLKAMYEQRRGPGKALLNDLWSISRKGLRDMINQISEFSWLEYLDGKKSELNARFTQQYYPSMLAYMLAGYRRYTQFSGNVPNIYLVNAPSPSNEIGVPDSFKKPHIYTIWLKRLILEYLLNRKQYNTTVLDIIDMFCGKNRRGYSEDLVRYVLSSLLEVPTSELIEVDVAADGAAGAHSYVRRVAITERGEFILSECSNSFKYLQLMVDDWKILLPRSLHDLFGYVLPDYSYLVATGGVYGASLDEILKLKGRQTFYFSLLIEEALAFERRMWPKVFDRLRAEGVEPLRNTTPSGTVRGEIQAISDALHLSIQLDYLLPEQERRSRAVIRGALEELFRPCREFRQRFYQSW